MVVHQIWLLIPSLSRVFEVANQFLCLVQRTPRRPRRDCIRFLRVHTNYWMSSVDEDLFDSSNIAELSIALRMLGGRD